jgi:hypothetical protein
MKTIRKPLLNSLNNFLNSKMKFVDKIICTDESIFTINGHVNRHNTAYRSASNPQIILNLDNLGDNVMVWAGLWSSGRVGPFFFNGSVAAKTYLKLLHGEVWPAISWNVKREKLYFEQMVLQHIMAIFCANGLIPTSRKGGLAGNQMFLGHRDRQI